LSKDNLIVGVEIEKTSEKTIWFDLIKLMMLVEISVAKFGVLVVPRNYAHKISVWDLFEKARYYKWCLEKYAKVKHNLLSKIAIVGYTQEVRVSGKWKPFDHSVIQSIKEQARKHFNRSRR
jgi:hypothetical protein